jgi:HTH-type transcriptional regulator, competence development regulator
MTPQQVFARNLRHHRHTAGLSQERLALAAKLHRTEISLLERGGRDARISTVARLARALNVPARELMNDVEKARPTRSEPQ